MKALVLRNNAELAYEDVADPVPGQIGIGGDDGGGEVLVRVAYAGICGSDLPRGFNGKAYHYPLVMGHEFSGTVAEAPSGSGFASGDRVVLFPLLPCRRCAACGTGDYAQCSDYDYYGSRRDGGFAEYVRVPARNLFRVPDRVSLLSASMTEPCAVALHGVNKLEVRPGMGALVIGGGPIGLMVAQWLRIRGCSRVYVSDVDVRKRDIAAALGFTAIDSSGGPTSEKYDLAAGLRKLEGRDGVDCVVEACGLPATFLQAVQCAGRFGQIVFMGNIHGTFQVPEVDFTRILRNEVRISGTWNSKIEPRGRDEWTAVLAHLDAAMQVQPLISHTVPLAEGVSMFGRMAARAEWYNKVIFSVHEER